MATSRKMVLLLGAEAVSAVLGWLSVKLILLKMGEGALGALAFALSLVGSFTFLALMGFRQAHIKRVSEGRDLGRCLGTMIRIRALQLALLGLAVVGALAVRLYIWDKPLVDAPWELVLLILFYYLLFHLAGVANATFTALQQTSKLTLPTLAGNVLRLSMMSLVALLGWSVLYLGWAYLLGGLLTLVLFAILIRAYPLKKPRKEDYASYWRYSKPLLVMTTVSTLALYADKLLLGVFRDQDELGVFYALQRLAALLLTLSVALETLLFPQLSKLHAGKSTMAAIKERVHLSERWLALAAAPVVAVAWALPDPTIRVLLSADVATPNGYLILRLLTLTMLLRILWKPYGVTLKAIDRPDLRARVGIIGGLVALGLSFALIPGDLHYLNLSMADMGAVGAAWALLATGVVRFGLLQYHTRRELKLTSSPKMVCPLLAAALTMAALWLLDTHLWSVERWYELALAGLAGLGLFWSLMAAMRQVGRQDIEMIMEALHPGEMGRYVVGELKEKGPGEGE